MSPGVVQTAAGRRNKGSSSFKILLIVVAVLL